MVALVRRLRGAGVAVSTGETLDAVRALNAVGPYRRDTVRSALLATLVKDSAHSIIFERAFNVLFPRWRDETAGSLSRADSTRDPADTTHSTHTSPIEHAEGLRAALATALKRGEDATVAQLLELAVRQWAGIDGMASGERHYLNRVLRRLDLGALLALMSEQNPERSELDRRIDAAEAAQLMEEIRHMLERLVAERLGGAASDVDAQQRTVTGGVELADRPILVAGPDEIAALRAAVRPLARKIAARLGRRHRRGSGRLDMRRTVRLSMGSGGVPLYPQLRRRAPTKPDLAVLCDVSGSMAQFAPFALALVHALHREFSRVRSWVFIDGIVEITNVVASASGVLDARRLLDRRGLVAADGRSDYARAFRTFLSTSADVVTGKTTVLIVGDARSHDRPPALEQLAWLGRHSRRLYWLNPEPRHEWDTGDSAMSSYALYCTRTFEVSTLRQLSTCVAAVA